MNNKYYAGIGSREAPQWALDLASTIGYELAKRGYTLRSGGASGMDEWFERGVYKWEKENGVCGREIWLPWHRFRANEHFCPKYTKTINSKQVEKNGELLIQCGILKHFRKMKPPVQKLHARNVFQITGDGSSLISEFVVFWAEIDINGEVKGGTRTAVKLAKKMGIPVFNLNDPKRRVELLELLHIVEVEEW